jgi:hypothetical protein
VKTQPPHESEPAQQDFPRLARFQSLGMLEKSMKIGMADWSPAFSLSLGRRRPSVYRR